MATHKLDGDDVNLGDQVFDIVYGTGEVVELKVEGRFRVRFAGNKFFVFDGNGVRADAKNRTLYWHDPVLVVPMKDDINWVQARGLCRAMIDKLREYQS